MAASWRSPERADLRPFVHYYIARYQAGLKKQEGPSKNEPDKESSDGEDGVNLIPQQVVAPGKRTEPTHRDQQMGMSPGAQA